MIQNRFHQSPYSSINKKRSICFWISVFLLSTLPFAHAVAESISDPIDVTFINPGISDTNDPTGGFWLSVSAFMKAAANDLNINLEIIYSERDHIRMQKQGLEVANRKNKPDYLILVNEKKAAEKMLIAADKAGIKTFLLNNRFEGKQREKIGEPRSKYKNYVGSLIPDNEYAGYTIAKFVVAEAIKQELFAKDGTLQILAIAGDYNTQASVERVDGLKRALKEFDKAKLLQVFTGMWRSDRSKQMTENALKRYPEIGAIWAANDPMAIGAMQALSDSGRSVGKDVIVGGLNWDKPAMSKIETGQMVVSAGGHFMTGGWLMVMLYDLHHGKDFSDDYGVEVKQQIFGALHKGNIDSFQTFFSNRNWEQIDFRGFSRFLNTKLKHYQFSPEAILRQQTEMKSK